MDLTKTRIMDLLRYFVYSTVAVLVFVKDVHADITVTTTVNPVGSGLLGDNEVELVCTYSLTSTDQVFTIAWQREIAKDNGSYEQVALFRPPGSLQTPAVLRNLTNPTVFGRVVITNPTDSSLTAKMKFTSVVCGDERKYQCIVVGLNNGVVPDPNPSSITSLTVTAKPNATAFNEVGVSPSANVEEGQTVTFTCTGNVGRPAGSFVWTRYKGTINTGGTTIVSTTQTSPSTDCTFTGSSQVSITTTKDDNDIIVKCALQHSEITDPTDTAYFKLTDVINVYYQVRAPTITKSPNAAVHYEDTTLTLTCAAEGNPAPTYVWWVNGTQVGTEAQLQLTNIKIAQSGDYVCEATNNFNGNTYNLNSTVSIVIETPPTTTPTTTTVTSVAPTGGGGGGTQEPQNEDKPEGLSTTIIIVIVVVVVVVVVVVAVIAFICLKRRNANKSIEEPPEKPRNNSDLSFVNKPPDVIRNDEKRGNNMGYNNFDKPKGELQYADLTFDDRPRSRRPIQILDADLGPTTYSEVTMPSV